jgi:hypothetical protein
LQQQEIANKEFMIRVVAPVRPPARNDDLAIATFDPLTGNALNFGR